MGPYFSDQQLEGIARQASYEVKNPCERFASNTWSDLSKRQKFLVDLAVISSVHTETTISAWTKGWGRTRKIENWVADHSNEIFVFYLTSFIIGLSLQDLFTDSFVSQLRSRTKLVEEEMLSVVPKPGYSIIDYAMEQHQLFGKIWCKSLTAAGLRGDDIPSLDAMSSWIDGVRNIAVGMLISDFAENGHMRLKSILKLHFLDSEVKELALFLQGNPDDDVVESSADDDVVESKSAQKRRLYLEQRKWRSEMSEGEGL